LRDNDNDNRKALRLLYFHITDMVASLAGTAALSQQQVAAVFDVLVRPSC
jgi:hypothetical protein